MPICNHSLLQSCHWPKVNVQGCTANVGFLVFFSNYDFLLCFDGEQIELNGVFPTQLMIVPVPVNRDATEILFSISM